MSGEEDKLDQRVREFLVDKLDAQRGRAGRVFDEMIRQQRRRRRWMIAGASGLIAASVLVATVMWRPVHELPTRVAVEDTNMPRDVEQLTAWQASDDGMTVLDNRIPVRRVRRQAVDEVKWFDPQLKSVVRMTIPREQVILVKQDIY